MTTALFLSRHSPQWSQIKDDLLALLDFNSPAHDADRLPIAANNEARETVNAAFADRVAGYSIARRLLHNLLPLDSVAAPEEATFEPPVDEDATRQTFPDMPVPIRAAPEIIKPKRKSK